MQQEQAQQFFQIVHASVTGKHHRIRGKANEDAIAIVDQEDIQAVIMADGGGSCRYPKEAARLAVNFAKATICDPEFKTICLTSVRGESSESRWQRFLYALVWRIRLQLLSWVSITNSADYGSTLLIALAYQNRLGVAQVGDGYIAGCINGEQRLLSTPFKGEFLGETSFVSSRRALKRLCCASYPLKAVSSLLITTDGLEHILYDRQRQAIGTNIYSKLLRFAQQPQADTQKKNQLLTRTLEQDWIDHHPASEQDDKTLAILVPRA